MKLPAQALLIACTALVAAAAAAPVVTPALAPAVTPAPAMTAPAPAAAAAPAPTPASAPGGDYTSRSLDPELVPEYDPATAPPTPMADPTDEGGLRQCVGPDGVPIFTDRRCADLGATPQVQAPDAFGALASASQVRVRTCARTQAVLLDGVRAALESHDANRLADYYHWSGMDTAEGYRLMDRLDAFSARPVVDVQLVRDAPPPPSQDASYGALYFDTPPRLPPSEPLFGTDGEALPGAASSAPGAPAAPPRARRLASMLRVDQMRSDQDVASTVTYFHLLTNAGCWWMRF